MINLLPTDDKRQLEAARSNTLLVRYNLFLLGAVMFMMLAIGFIYVYLNNAKAASETTINENQSKVTDFAPIEKEATEFRSNLATAKQILDREVIYTKVVLEIAHLMPAGTILDNLALDSTTFGKPTTIIAKAKTYNSALSIKDTFQKSNIFSDVHFESVTINDADTSGYPMTVNLSVTIKKDAAK
jgi:hypothetical protein